MIDDTIDDDEPAPITAFSAVGLDAAAGPVPADMLAEGCECPGEHECGVTTSSLSNWFFTFGYGQTHPVTGHGLMDRFVRIRAVDEHAARARMIKHFGVRWAFQYPASEFGGIIARYGLEELPESEWPPPLERVVEALPARKIIGVRELRAPCANAWVEQVLGADFMLRAVLVSGKIGDVAAYIGMGPAEWVAESGNKLSFTLACGFFPGLEERLYRP